MALEEGLRQGCVLIPILYCVFLNCVLAAAPVGLDVPGEVEDTVRELFFHGLQQEGEDGEGVYSSAQGKMVRAFLFMDDTTLVASTLQGLQVTTGKYMNFCKKFRMRLNKTNISRSSCI